MRRTKLRQALEIFPRIGAAGAAVLIAGPGALRGVGPAAPGNGAD